MKMLSMISLLILACAPRIHTSVSEVAVVMAVDTNHNTMTVSLSRGYVVVPYNDTYEVGDTVWVRTVDGSGQLIFSDSKVSE